MTTQQLTVLVRRNDRRYMALCADGTLALVWERAVVQFCPNELERVVRLLECWASDLEQTWASDDLLTICRDAGGAMQLWLDGVGLYLTGDDLLVLASLVQIAMLRLQESSPHVLAARSHTEAFYALHLPPDTRVWHN